MPSECSCTQTSPRCSYRKQASHRKVDGVCVRNRCDGVTSGNAVRAVDCANVHKLPNVGRSKPMIRLGDADAGCAVNRAGQTLANKIRKDHREVVVCDTLRKNRLVTRSKRAAPSGCRTSQKLAICRSPACNYQVARRLRNANASTKTTLRKLRSQQARSNLRE